MAERCGTIMKKVLLIVEVNLGLDLLHLISGPQQDLLCQISWLLRVSKEIPDIWTLTGNQNWSNMLPVNDTLWTQQGDYQLLSAF